MEGQGDVGRWGCLAGVGGANKHMSTVSKVVLGWFCSPLATFGTLSGRKFIFGRE